jgi:histidinol-phosphate/aromatic aminotransferase/cobyric acid decarboxylase-like protein
MSTAPAIIMRPRGRYVVEMATPAQREAIYRMRHSIYATELAQHPENALGALRDDLDERNAYIVASVDGEVVGFVSVTPPGGAYSIDRYFPREALPFACDEGLHELRLLTVAPGHRRGDLAALLMYAAFRWVEAKGGTHVVALGRDAVLGLYLQIGLRPTGESVRAGAVLYHLLHERLPGIRAAVAGRAAMVRRLERESLWALPVPFAAAAGCYHGGAFFEAVGDEFDRLERSREIINADVLDAWFPPSPRVLATLREHLPWLLRTSPPTDCAGLLRTIARVRGVEASHLLAGAGSSDLIFRALPRWLSRDSRVLILDPMYGEYAHLLEAVVRCRVDRFPLERDEGYRLDPARLLERLDRVRYDLAILVNPNSPTGRHLGREALQRVLADAPRRTRFWIDETYVDYAGDDESLEHLATARDDVVVCKSMSKVYALSGLRVAYLCGAPPLIDELRARTPPWVVGLPAQVAAVNALDDLPYYRARWAETHALRTALADALRGLGMEVVPGVANFLLFHLPEGGPDAGAVVTAARAEGCFLRDVAPMGSRLGARAVRIAVKDAVTNRRMIDILSRIMSG